jgi:DNA-binding transcriptional ArsR family regulator
LLNYSTLLDLSVSIEDRGDSRQQSAARMSPPGGRKASGRSQRRASGTRKGETTRTKAETKRKGPSARGETRKARERAEGLIDPNLSVLARDPLRVQIVAMARQRPISPSEFRREVGIPQNVASYHFKVLREHGFLEIIAEIPVRGATKHMHIATKSGFISDQDWGQVEEALRPGVAGAILQDFNGRVSEAMETGTLYERDDACIYWVPRDYDDIAWKEQVEIIAWCIEESKRLEDDTVKRRAAGKSKVSFPATFAIAGFTSPTTSQIKKAKRKADPKRKRKSSTGKGKKPPTKGTRRKSNVRRPRQEKDGP